jgi:hypothetical protein
MSKIIPNRLIFVRAVSDLVSDGLTMPRPRVVVTVRRENAQAAILGTRRGPRGALLTPPHGVITAPDISLSHCGVERERGRIRRSVWQLIGVPLLQ